MGGRKSENYNVMGFWEGKRVLITGATGILGSNLTKKLCDLGADVVCIVRDWVPQSELVLSGYLEKVKVVRGEITDYYLIRRTLAEYEIEFVFHLGAQTIVPIANKDPLSTFESNIRGTYTLLDAIRTSGRDIITVVASSDKAYGEKENLPYTEDMCLTPIYPYDVSKACAELISTSYVKTFGLKIAITRCGNFFGEGDLNFSRVVPGTILSVLKNEPPVIRSDGSPIRDYIYVEDVSEAYILLAEKLCENPSLSGEAFNFSYEKPLSVLEIVNLILKLMNSNLKPIIKNEAKAEIKNQYLSAEKAKRVLGWKPKFSLEEGLIKTIKWYEKLFSKKEKS